MISRHLLEIEFQQGECMKQHQILIGLLAFIFGSSAWAQGASSGVHLSYHWHMHQPIYWPEKLPGTDRVQFAGESYDLKSRQASFIREVRFNILKIIWLQEMSDRTILFLQMRIEFKHTNLEARIRFQPY